MEDLCRICMTPTENLIPMVKGINENECMILENGRFFENCFGIKLQELQIFYKLCSNCNIKLNMFNDFKMQALQTHRNLIELELKDENLNSMLVKHKGGIMIQEEDLIESLCTKSTEMSNKENDTKVKIETEYSSVNEDELDEDHVIIEYLDYDNCLESLSSLDNSTIMDDEDDLNSYVIKNKEDGDINQSDLKDFVADLIKEGDNIPKEICEGCHKNDGENSWYSEKKIKNEKCKISSEKREHGTAKNWQYHCNMCKKRFRNEITFQAHQNVHKGLAPYNCDICKKGFKFKVNFDYHMKNHNNLRDFKCSLCGKSFISNWDLKIHMRCHGDIRPFVCDICGKQFRIKVHLTDHLETHSASNRHECPICFQKYKTKQTLKMHISSVHVRDQKFFCHICGKIFYRRHHLNVHLRVHQKHGNILVP